MNLVLAVFAVFFTVVSLPLIAEAAPPARNAYPHIEVKFDISDITGNPFDFKDNDVRVIFTDPGKATVTIPAFFDGGMTWRARMTPGATGKYALSAVTRNGKPIAPQNVSQKTFDVPTTPTPGFIRRDAKDSMRLTFENGVSYYPLGHNVAWGNGQQNGDDIVRIFEKMHGVGENWARVWMCHWDGKNPDWKPGEALKPGELSLDVLRKWDRLLDAAEKNGIFIQMTLQHHGPYSSDTDSNWNDNPWNAKNGGFLKTPAAFFTDPEALRRTRMKFRYYAARFGYSTAIVAWELFNEVEWTNGVRENPQSVADWHREMAEVLRASDPNRHLVTTSSKRDIPGLYEAMDYAQPHAYPPGAVSTVTSLKRASEKKPVFFGEIGPGSNLKGDDGAFLRDALWGSLMSESSGAAQYWDWENVERRNLYPFFGVAAAFLKVTNLGGWNGATYTRPMVDTVVLGPIMVTPGGGWSKATQTKFEASPAGDVPGVEKLPSYLQGNNHRDLFTFADFVINFREPGRCIVTLGTAAKAGAHPSLSVDGKPVADREFAAAATDTRVNTALEAEIPTGLHTIRLENTGTDWVTLVNIRFTSSGPSKTALAKVAGDRAAAWVFTTDPTAPAPPRNARPDTLLLLGLEPGDYRIRWWDITTGKEFRAMPNGTVAANHQLRTPLPDASQAALYVERVGK